MLLKKQKRNNTFYVVALLWLCCLFTTNSVVAQSTAKVKGLVQNEQGEPLTGVTVSIFNNATKSKTSTLTNEKGMFEVTSLLVGNSYNLEYSYVGYVTGFTNDFKVKEGDNNTLIIKLKQSAESINEDVVVVGFGTKRKNAVTGAISTIQGSEFSSRPITQASQLFYGLIPGVFANSNTGEAGNGETTIRIRGVGTLNDASALILVDGIEAPIDNISPNDIESVTVLKDAAAAAIYGSRAANGVVLVTTKRGKFNTKVKVDYNGYYGTSSPTILPNMVTDNATYLQLYKEAAANTNVSTAGITDADIERYRTLPSTNWFDVIFHKKRTYSGAYRWIKGR